MQFDQSKSELKTLWPGLEWVFQPAMGRRTFQGQSAVVSHEHVRRGVVSANNHPYITIILTLHTAKGLIRQQTTGGYRENKVDGRHIVCVPANLNYDMQWDDGGEIVRIFPAPALLAEMKDSDVGGVFARGSLSEGACDRVLWEMVGAISFACSEDEPDAAFITGSAGLVVRRLFSRYAIPSQPTGASRLSDNQRQRMDAFIQTNLGKRFRIPELSRAVGLSPQRFTPVCFNTTGKTPMDYVWECRLWKAHAMASAGTYRRREIVRACGFADLSHLNRRFRAFFGIHLGVLMTRLKSASRSKRA